MQFFQKGHSNSIKLLTCPSRDSFRAEKVVPKRRQHSQILTGGTIRDVGLLALEHVSTLEDAALGRFFLDPSSPKGLDDEMEDPEPKINK